MTSNKISVNGYEIESVLKLDIDKKIWKHPTAYFEGHIHESLAETASDEISSKQQLIIKATDSTGTEKVIFNGIVEDICVDTCNDASKLIVSGIGHSAKLDVDRKIRTFQADHMTYKQVAGHLEEDMESAYLIPQAGDNPIGHMLVQYDETNWEYAKRLASEIGTVVVADSTLDFPNISIGVPKRNVQGVINSTAFKTGRDINFFLRHRHIGNRRVNEFHTQFYSVSDRAFYDLCDRIIFNGQELLASEANIKFVSGELIGTYRLMNENAFISTQYCNERIIGASITGVVKEVKDDLVRVDLLGDIDQIEDKWFWYSTPYSSGDGTGWYFMPEIGDEIRLQFPTQEEHFGYVISSTHITHGDRTNPEIKFIRTIRNQTITFYPDAIHIDDGQGSEIMMDKEKGILINTDKSLSMDVQENLHMSAQGKILVHGDEAVLLRQNDSVVKIEETIDMTAKHVRVQ